MTITRYVPFPLEASDDSSAAYMRGEMLRYQCEEAARRPNIEVESSAVSQSPRDKTGVQDSLSPHCCRSKTKSSLEEDNITQMSVK